MRTTEIIDKLAFGESTKKNVNKLNQLIEQVNNNTEHIILADEKTIRKIEIDGEDRLATNMEILTLDQFQTLVNGQKVTLVDGREIEFDEECIYYITDDNGDAILNNLYKRIDYGMIRGWANNMVCDETLDPVPTLKYLYAYAPVDGPVNGHPMYTCRITKLSDEFIEVEATDLYTGYNYVTVKKDGVWSEWISSTPEFMCANSDVTIYVSPDGDDINGAGTQDSPYKTFGGAIKSFPPVRNGFTYCIRANTGSYDGFILSGMDIELLGYDDTPGILTFTSPIKLLNGASLIADSDTLLSINFNVPGNSIAINVDRHSSLFINSNVVIFADSDANNVTGIAVSNGSVCTLYSSLIATNLCAAIKANSAARVFVDAITAISCDYAGVADRGAVIGYVTSKCTNMAHEFVGLHGGRTIRGNQGERHTIVGDNSGVNYKTARFYKAATLEICGASREVKTTFSIRSTYHNSDQYGLLTVDFSTNSDMSGLDYVDAYWEYASAGIDPHNFVIMYRVMNNKLEAMLYVAIKEAWQTYSVIIKHDSRRSQPYPYDDDQWVLSQNFMEPGVESQDIESDTFTRITPRISGYQLTENHIKQISNFNSQTDKIDAQDEKINAQATKIEAQDAKIASQNDKINAFVLYSKTWGFSIDEYDWSLILDVTSPDIVAETKINNPGMISADDSVEISVNGDALETLSSNGMTLSGETYDGYILLTVVGQSGQPPKPGSLSGTYKIRKAILDQL